MENPFPVKGLDQVRLYIQSAWISSKMGSEQFIVSHHHGCHRHCHHCHGANVTSSSVSYLLVPIEKICWETISASAMKESMLQLNKRIPPLSFPSTTHSSSPPNVPHVYHSSILIIVLIINSCQRSNNTQDYCCVSALIGDDCCSVFALHFETITLQQVLPIL